MKNKHHRGEIFQDARAGPSFSRKHLFQSLPPLQQQILRMRFGQDFSCREIATTLGKQENVVRVTLSRSLNLLRKIYRRRREEQETLDRIWNRIAGATLFVSSVSKRVSPGAET